MDKLLSDLKEKLSSIKKLQTGFFSEREIGWIEGQEMTYENIIFDIESGKYNK